MNELAKQEYMTPDLLPFDWSESL